MTFRELIFFLLYFVHLFVHSRFPRDLNPLNTAFVPFFYSKFFLILPRVNVDIKGFNQQVFFLYKNDWCIVVVIEKHLWGAPNRAVALN